MLVSKLLLRMLLLAAIGVPFINAKSTRSPISNMPLSAFTQSLVETKKLKEVSLTEREGSFGSSFPGVIRRFTGAESEYIFRTVSTATRLLHPSSDCFRGLGYAVTPLPAETDEQSILWSCFKAEKSTVALRVCEHISGANSGHWPDVPTWFWSAAFYPATAPWTAITRAEPIR